MQLELRTGNRELVLYNPVSTESPASGLNVYSQKH